MKIVVNTKDPRLRASPRHGGHCVSYLIFVTDPPRGRPVLGRRQSSYMMERGVTITTFYMITTIQKKKKKKLLEDCIIPFSYPEIRYHKKKVMCHNRYKHRDIMGKGIVLSCIVRHFLFLFAVKMEFEKNYFFICARYRTFTSSQFTRLQNASINFARSFL
jgi:hypothetical protein